MTVSELWRSFQLYLFIFEVNRLSQKRRENQRKYHHTEFFYTFLQGRRQKSNKNREINLIWYHTRVL